MRRSRFPRQIVFVKIEINRTSVGFGGLWGCEDGGRWVGGSVDYGGGAGSRLSIAVVLLPLIVLPTRDSEQVTPCNYTCVINNGKHKHTHTLSSCTIFANLR